MVTRGKSSELLAYIAGIVDGEGCVNLYGSGPNYAPRVSVYNSSLELMELLEEEFGGTIAVMRNGGNEHPKTVYHWHLGYRKCGPFLMQIVPFLRIKKRQAILLLAYLKTVPEGNTRGCMVFGRTIQVRKYLFDEMKKLNGRRPQRLSETASGPEEAIVCSASKDVEARGTETTCPA